MNPSVGFSDRRKSKPIGLAYLMAYLRANGFESTGFDFGDSEDDPVELAELYGLDTFDIVGFSVYNESFRATAATASWIKSRNPDCLVVLGGPHATAVHEQILRRYPCVDTVIRREGEAAMLELVRAYREPHVLTKIAGTTWRAGDGLTVNVDRAFVPDLDQIPFPDAEFISHSGYPSLTYYDEVQGRLKPALTICSSRSCPYNCSFCGVLTIGRKYRSRDASRVAEELRHFRDQHGVNYQHVYFSDANFFVSPPRALEVAQALHEVDPAVTFSFGTRVNQILKAAAVLPELKKYGLRFIELGIESASAPVLERLAKSVTPDVNVAAVRLLRRLGIEISLDFIMLDPATTLADVRANLEFLRDNGFYDYLPHDHLYSALVLYQGTPIRDFYAARRGVEFDPDDLPNPYTMFEVPEVQRLSDELHAFRRDWQGRIDDALAQGELALLSMADNPDAPRLAQAWLQIDVVSLRHAPNLFFEHLLADAESGFPRLRAQGAGSLLPSLGPDSTTLPQVLERVESTAHAAGFTPEREQLTRHERGQA
ncbi:B12-binding domain-containing radical SAM protein [Streptomyces youssoufiensis]